MQIKTIDDTVVDTDKLLDANAQMIELIENSGIRKLAMEYGGSCFVYGKVNKGPAWITVHTSDTQSINDIVNAVSSMVYRATGGKTKLSFVQVDSVLPDSAGGG